MPDVDGVHDLGGMHGFGPVPIEADEPLFHEPWEGRVWRMLGVVMGSTTIDRFRYTIEQMPPAEYLASSYYERWLWAVENLAAEQGILDSDERPPPIARPSPTTPTWPGRFQAGDRVRVRNPVTSGHTRVPRYLRRHVGRVERVAFAWPNPGASAATGTYGEPELVYTVAFAAADLFDLAADHTLTADLGESDLEEVSPPRSGERRSRAEAASTGGERRRRVRRASPEGLEEVPNDD
jgi:nitrile hydratase subunit beta